MFKIDLHTHSVASPDGGITRQQYQSLLHDGTLDYVAVTDHNTTTFATELHAEFGNRIIIGEEIMTTAGEIIGLYLDKVIDSGLSPLETVKQIKDQGGLVYLPHPFETIRKGLHPTVLSEIIDYVDIVEVFNGRAIRQSTNAQAAVWARLHGIIGAASSDAHGFAGLGRTFTQIENQPTADNLLAQVASGRLAINRPTLRALLYPKYHRVRKKLRGHR